MLRFSAGPRPESTWLAFLISRRSRSPIAKAVAGPPNARPAMNVLSIQSTVAYGHVGNAAAVFPLQCLGHEVWPVDTVRFSNHPGHGRFRGRVTPPEEVAELAQGL